MSREAPVAAKNIAIFGEDESDRVCIRELLLGLRPDVARSETTLLRKPLTLVKDMDEAKRKSRGEKVVAALRAANIRKPLRAAIFHEDADAVEPSHVTLIETVKRTYSLAPCDVLAAVPAWEIETWWFLFPDAVGKVNGQWRAPDQYVGRSAGKIRNSKEKLRECVRPSGVRRGPRFREYEESDSASIARNVVGMNLLDLPKAESESWAAFVDEVRSLEPVRPRRERSGKARSGPAARGARP